MILNANPGLENLKIQKKLLNQISITIKRGNYILGDQVKKFENEFAKFIGTKYSVSVNSGTDAIYLSLRLLNLKKNDEVILPAMSASATASAVMNSEVKPIFVDIDKYSYNLSTKDLERKITKKTKAVIVVHLHGQPAKINKIIKIINKKNNKIKLIEDCAQSHGAKLNGKKTGSFGMTGCFSFYPTKNLGAIGDGGIITTNNKSLYIKLKKLRQYGWGEKDNSILQGINSRLDELQAALLRVKLKNLNRNNLERRKIAKHYLKNLKNDKIILPQIENINNHVFHHFLIKLRKGSRSNLIKKFRKKGIQLNVHYPIPLYKQKAFKNSNYKLKNCEEVSKKIISLPIYPGLKKKYQIKIIKVFNSL